MEGGALADAERGAELLPVGAVFFVERGRKGPRLSFFFVSLDGEKRTFSFLFSFSSLRHSLCRFDLQRGTLLVVAFCCQGRLGRRGSCSSSSSSWLFGGGHSSDFFSSARVIHFFLSCSLKKRKGRKRLCSVALPSPWREPCATIAAVVAAQQQQRHRRRHRAGGPPAAAAALRVLRRHLSAFDRRRRRRRRLRLLLRLHALPPRPRASSTT